MEGQVAIVTGAGAGIGRAIAETFAAAGAAVMVSDLHLDTASAVSDAINTSGGKAAAAACDVTNEDDLARIIAETVENFGKLTHLVSNAGGGSRLGTVEVHVDSCLADTGHRRESQQKKCGF